MSASRRAPQLYRYDPLDRLVACAPAALPALQRFYCVDRLVSETQGTLHRSVFQQGGHLLAQQTRQGASAATGLLATNVQRSVLQKVDTSKTQSLAYTPYGYCPSPHVADSLLAFTGEPCDAVTGHYLLGNGYRAYNPQLMRFNSPDTMSPFDKGGFNAYAYCGGDPVNRTDPTGQFWGAIRDLFRSFSNPDIVYYRGAERLNTMQLPRTFDQLATSVVAVTTDIADSLVVGARGIALQQVQNIRVVRDGIAFVAGAMVQEIGEAIINPRNVVMRDLVPALRHQVERLEGNVSNIIRTLL